MLIIVCKQAKISLYCSQDLSNVVRLSVPEEVEAEKAQKQQKVMVEVAGDEDGDFMKEDEQGDIAAAGVESEGSMDNGAVAEKSIVDEQTPVKKDMDDCIDEQDVRNDSANMEDVDHSKQPVDTEPKDNEVKNETVEETSNRDIKDTTDDIAKPTAEQTS